MKANHSELKAIDNHWSCYHRTKISKVLQPFSVPVVRDVLQHGGRRTVASWDRDPGRVAGSVF